MAKIQMTCEFCVPDEVLEEAGITVEQFADSLILFDPDFEKPTMCLAQNADGDIELVRSWSMTLLDSKQIVD